MPMFFQNSRQRQFFHFASQPRVSESSWAGWAPQPALRAGSQLGSLGCDCLSKPTLGGLGSIDSDVANYYGVSNMTAAERKASKGAQRFKDDCARLGFTAAKQGTSYDDLCIDHMYKSKLGPFAPAASKPTGDQPSWVLPVAIAAGAFALLYAITE